MVIAEAFQLFGAGSIFASGKSSIKSSIPDQTQMWRVPFLVAGTCRKADMSEAPAGLRSASHEAAARKQRAWLDRLVTNSN
jgi:hypothetical protein